MRCFLFLFLVFSFPENGFSQLTKNQSWQKAFAFVSERLAEIDKSGYKIIAFTTTNNYSSEIIFKPEGDSIFIEAFANINKGSIADSKIKLLKRDFDFKTMKASSDTLIDSNSFQYNQYKNGLRFSKISVAYKKGFDFKISTEFLAKLSVSLEGVSDSGILPRGAIPYDHWVYGIVVYAKYSK